MTSDLKDLKKYFEQEINMKNDASLTDRQVMQGPTLPWIYLERQYGVIERDDEESSESEEYSDSEDSSEYSSGTDESLTDEAYTVSVLIGKYQFINAVF
jgi:hypothetical protein